MRAQLAFAALTASLALQACSSRPREFTATPGAATADSAAFAAAFEECRQLVAAGKLDANGRLASAGAGAAAGAATVAAGAAAATTTTGFGAMAAAGATIVALPIVAVAGAWGLARNKKKKKEAAIQTATAGCLKERGYEVVGWTKASKQERAARKKAR